MHVSRTLVAVLTVLVTAVAACSPRGGGGEVERIPGVRPGLGLIPIEERVQAPAVPVEILGADGERMALPDLRGQIVVLNFWASWCGPCRAEQPELNAAYAAVTDAGEPVSFLGVNIQDEVANAQAHEREFEMPYASVYDPSNAFSARFAGVGPRSIPTTILLDAEGRVAVRLFGTTDAIEVLALTELLLDEST